MLRVGCSCRHGCLAAWHQVTDMPVAFTVVLRTLWVSDFVLIHTYSARNWKNAVLLSGGHPGGGHPGGGHL